MKLQRRLVPTPGGTDTLETMALNAFALGVSKRC
jgi:hypothetical protein